MARELKSFKKDWQRWTISEKLIAVALLVVATIVLGGPVTTLL